MANKTKVAVLEYEYYFSTIHEHEVHCFRGLKALPETLANRLRSYRDRSNHEHQADNYDDNAVYYEPFSNLFRLFLACAENNIKIKPVGKGNRSRVRIWQRAMSEQLAEMNYQLPA